jgi:hypothetical protein
LVEKEAFGAYLVLKGNPFPASEYLRELIRQDFDPLLISPDDAELPSDPEIEVLEPERGNQYLPTDSLLYLLRTMIAHFQRGDRRAVVITDLQVLKGGSSFHELSDFIGRLYEEACVNRGLLLMFADPAGFTHQEMAFLERETSVIDRPEQLS